MRVDMCPRGHIARRSNKNWQNYHGTPRGNVRQSPGKVHWWKVRGRNCLNPVTIGHSISRDQVSFSGTVRHTMAPGGRWENYK